MSLIRATSHIASGASWMFFFWLKKWKYYGLFLTFHIQGIVFHVKKYLNNKTVSQCFVLFLFFFNSVFQTRFSKHILVSGDIFDNTWAKVCDVMYQSRKLVESVWLTPLRATGVMVHHGNAFCEFVCDKGLMNKGLNDKDVRGIFVLQTAIMWQKKKQQHWINAHSVFTPPNRYLIMPEWYWDWSRQIPLRVPVDQQQEVCLLEPTPLRMSTTGLGFDGGLRWQCQRLRPESSSWDWKTGLGAHSLEAGGPGLHPLAWSSSAERCESLDWPLPALFSPLLPMASQHLHQLRFSGSCC